ncbi:hypothetical protein ULG90_22435 [Halopseudomonas pachastrellae]|nr:hypothetical protein ULG90_22435 [Halopseudomonas pachastrellae]
MLLQRALHHIHGLLVATGARQMNGGGPQGFRVLRRNLYPQARHFQGGWLVAQKLGNAQGAFADAGITGAACLAQVVVQCQVKAVALAGNFGAQQLIERVLLKVAVGDRGVGCRLGFAGARRLGRCGWRVRL